MDTGQQRDAKGWKDPGERQEGTGDQGANKHDE
jgi:hypothetical protein